ncbi:MAG TPA: hypothetical protein VE993_06610 [Stellaceae bacterium]|nr:hypothetical protein [Stellaceae bacterium]
MTDDDADGSSSLNPKTGPDPSPRLLRATSLGARRQPGRAALAPSGMPSAHRGTGDAELAGNLGSAEPAGAEEPRRGHASLFALGGRQMPWSPHRHPSLQPSVLALYTNIREDH